MHFKNVLELLDYFKDESTCKAYLEQKRWGGTPACHHCGSIRVYRTKSGFKCAETLCNKKFSVTSGSIYHGTHLPLRIWFAAIYLASSSKKGISSLQLSRQLGITQKSGWYLLHRIREMLKAKAPKVFKDVVQIDETLIGGLNKNRHANKRHKNSQGGAGKSIVFGAYSIDGKIRTAVIPNCEVATIIPIVKDWMQKGSIIVTDEAKYYHSSLNSDYFHVAVNHSAGEYVRGGFTNNHVENFWSIFQRGIVGVYHFVSPKHLQRYCNEFSGRFNSRKLHDSERFNILLENTAQRLKYKVLIGKN